MSYLPLVHHFVITGCLSIIAYLPLVHQPHHLFMHGGVMYLSGQIAVDSWQIAVNDGVEMSSDGK